MKITKKGIKEAAQAANEAQRRTIRASEGKCVGCASELAPCFGYTTRSKAAYCDNNCCPNYNLLQVTR